MLHKILIDSKPLRVKFNQIDRFIGIYDRTRYLVLYESEKYDSLPLEKAMTFHNVIILIKPVWNKDKK